MYSWILIKAFDTVWREGLWCKLLMNQIIGKMHNAIVNMHRNVESVANINQENRVCNLCQSRELEDGYHYLFECTELTTTEPGGFLKNADVDQLL